MLERVWDENISYTNTFESFFEEEINLSANNGAVISVKFLLTPNAEFDGLPTNPVVLDSRNYDLIFTNGFEIDWCCFIAASLMKSWKSSLSKHQNNFYLQEKYNLQITYLLILLILCLNFIKVLWLKDAANH